LHALAIYGHAWEATQPVPRAQAEHCAEIALLRASFGAVTAPLSSALAVATPHRFHSHREPKVSAPISESALYRVAKRFSAEREWLCERGHGARPTRDYFRATMLAVPRLSRS
jgi:hypothetical protein